MNARSNDPVQAGGLTFLQHLPEGVRDGAPLLILLHGRGSDEADLQGLVPFLSSNLVVVTPRAPFPGMPWGYGPGWAWYRYAGGTQVEDETLEESLRTLDGFWDELEGALPIRPGVRILGGFSQGGTTSLAWALTRPGKVQGVAVFSGFRVDSPLLEGSSQAARGLPVFWGHGQADGSIPFEFGAAGRRSLEEAGALVTAVDHPGGHTISADELAAFRSWMEERRPAAPSSS